MTYNYITKYYEVEIDYSVYNRSFSHAFGIQSYEDHIEINSYRIIKKHHDYESEQTIINEIENDRDLEAKIFRSIKCGE